MKNIIYVLKNGKLYRYWLERKKVYCEEVCYVHFQKRKMVSTIGNVKEFIIGGDQFYPLVNSIGTSDVMKYSGKQHSINNALIKIKRRAYIVKSNLRL